VQQSWGFLVLIGGLFLTLILLTWLDRPTP